jgi:hypothetical protein
MKTIYVCTILAGGSPEKWPLGRSRSRKWNNTVLKLSVGKYVVGFGIWGAEYLGFRLLRLCSVATDKAFLGDSVHIISIPSQKYDPDLSKSTLNYYSGSNCRLYRVYQVLFVRDHRGRAGSRSGSNLPHLCSSSSR